MSEGKPARREFLRQIGRTGLALAGATAGAIWLHDRPTEVDEPAIGSFKRYGVELGPSEVRLAVVHGSSVEKMVRAAVGELGGISRFIRPGDVVVVKPNVAFDRGPSLAATTHPDTLKAVVKVCREAGAKKVIVTDNPINSPEGCFHKSGIQRAAEEAGATVLYPRASAFRRLRLQGKAISACSVYYQPLEEATRLIGVAPTKDHNLCQASMTMKNWYGLLGGQRSRFHQKIDTVVADLGSTVVPTLVFLDGTRLLMSNGPTGGSLSDVAPGDTIVCGVDPVSVDAYGFTLLRRNPDTLGYVQEAHARGIGNKNWRSVPWREISV